MDNNNIVYWKMKNGKSISVDDMDITHLRNAFKMLIRSHTVTVNRANEVIEEYNSLVGRTAQRDKGSFKMNGEMAQEFNDSYDDEDGWIDHDDDSEWAFCYDPNWD